MLCYAMLCNAIHGVSIYGLLLTPCVWKVRQTCLGCRTSVIWTSRVSCTCTAQNLNMVGTDVPRSCDLGSLLIANSVVTLPHAISHVVSLSHAYHFHMQLINVFGTGKNVCIYRASTSARWAWSGPGIFWGHGLNLQVAYSSWTLHIMYNIMAGAI